jgi:hypothetical protein
MSPKEVSFLNDSRLCSFLCDLQMPTVVSEARIVVHKDCSYQADGSLFLQIINGWKRMFNRPAFPNRHGCVLMQVEGNRYLASHKRPLNAAFPSC